MKAELEDSQLPSTFPHKSPLYGASLHLDSHEEGTILIPT